MCTRRPAVRGLMKPGMETAGRLIAIILDEPPGSEYVRLRTLTLIGSILMFRMAHATSMSYLDWKSAGTREVNIVRTLAAELVAGIRRMQPLEQLSTRIEPDVSRDLKGEDLEIISRSRSVPTVVPRRDVLARSAVSLLKSAMPVPGPVPARPCWRVKRVAVAR
jgi:CecR-like transcriptional dual regulator